MNIYIIGDFDKYFKGTCFSSTASVAERLPRRTAAQRSRVRFQSREKLFVWPPITLPVSLGVICANMCVYGNRDTGFP